MGHNDVSEGKQYGDGLASRSVVGSRLHKDGKEMAKNIGSSGLSLREKGDIVTKGEIKAQVSIQNGPLAPIGPITSKVRNQVGRKNPQLGPRVKDVKKMARSGNIQKKQLGVVKGPYANDTLCKENINLELLVGLGSLIKNGPDSFGVKQRHEAMDCTVSNQLNQKGNLSKIHEMPLVKEMFGNIQVENGKVESCLDKVLDQVDVKVVSAPRQKEDTLSEQKSKVVSL